MAATLNAIGLALMGVSMIPAIGSFFPAPYEASTVVRVAAGLSMPGEESYNTGGHTPGLALFDGDGNRIGFKSGTRNGIIEDGQFKDITVDPIDSSNNRPPEYISIVGGGTDAICVAYAAVTPPSEEYWIFYGDVPKQCGAAWYHSNLQVALQGNPYKPSCFWITSPNDKGQKSGNFPQGAAIHLGDFNWNTARAQQYQDHPDSMCQSTPRFKMYDSLTEMNCIPIFNPPLQYASDWTDPDLNALNTAGQTFCDPGPGTMPSIQQMRSLEQWSSGRFSAPTYGVKRSERSTKTRSIDPKDQACVDHHVVISDYEGHTATELCTSNTSVGPDFVSTKENLYCDMCTHELWHLCSATITQACFDMDTKKMRPGTGPQARDVESGREVPTKDYKKVTEWN